jgi:signal peptidase
MKRSLFIIVSDVLFFAAVFAILLTVLTSGDGSGTQKTVFGLSYYTVISRSMQDEIPKDSFILVKETDPKKLNVGDNITFMRDSNTSITHKIIDIFESSDGRGFKTMGVNNSQPDRDIVHESNVNGKVILVIPALGALMAYFGNNFHVVLIFYCLCIICSFGLRGLLIKRMERARNG